MRAGSARTTRHAASSPAVTTADDVKPVAASLRICLMTQHANTPTASCTVSCATNWKRSWLGDGRYVNPICAQMDQLILQAGSVDDILKLIVRTIVQSS